MRWKYLVGPVTAEEASRCWSGPRRHGECMAFSARPGLDLTIGVRGEDYRCLLRRARIVFNRSIRRECNLRTFEATSSGALLFQEADNREVPDYLPPGREYVAYTDDDLERLLEHHLTQEEERRAVAAAGQARVAANSFPSLWEAHLGLIEREWVAVAARMAHRPEEGADVSLLARTWQQLRQQRAQRHHPAGRRPRAPPVASAFRLAPGGPLGVDSAVGVRQPAPGLGGKHSPRAGQVLARSEGGRDGLPSTRQ